jgi:hypothetical protein
MCITSCLINFLLLNVILFDRSRVSMKYYPGFRYKKLFTKCFTLSGYNKNAVWRKAASIRPFSNSLVVTKGIQSGQLENEGQSPTPMPRYQFLALSA